MLRSSLFHPRPDPAAGPRVALDNAFACPPPHQLALLANAAVAPLRDLAALCSDALGPGSRVDQFRYNLATVDAGWKYRGWAANLEYYFRTLNGFQGTGPFERSSLIDHGGLGYLSWCFVPRKYEVYARSSVVTGPYGPGQEYGGGFKCYVNRSRQGRFTLEALHMNRNPAQNILYPYRAGSTGTAIQTQFMVSF
jgi:hypothetical protein